MIRWLVAFGMFLILPFVLRFLQKQKISLLWYSIISSTLVAVIPLFLIVMYVGQTGGLFVGLIIFVIFFIVGFVLQYFIIKR